MSLLISYKHRQLRDKLVNFLINPWFFAFPVTLVIFFFLPSIDKYKIELIKKGICDKPEGFVTLTDLNQDNISEKIILFNNQRGDAAIKAVNQQNVLLGWWDFKGSIYKGVPVSGDYNHDGRPEIYFLSNHADSIFLNMLFPDSNLNYSPGHFFITCTNIGDHKDDYRAGKCYFSDLQSDGNDEILFGIQAGYSLQPRRFYVFDIHNKILHSGPEMGCITNFLPVQLDDDAEIEFIGQSSSTGNMTPDIDIPFKDSSSWLMALNHKLNFMFDPVEFKGHKTQLQSQTLYIDNHTFILSLFDFSSVKPLKASLNLFDLNGNLIKKKELDKPTGQEFFALLPNISKYYNRVLMKDNTGNIFEIDENLNTRKFSKIPQKCNTNFEAFDLDRDGDNELIFLGNDFESVIVARHDFSHPAEIKVSFERMKSNLALMKNGENPPHLFIQRGEHEMLFSYGINPYWYMKVPTIIGIYFILLGFILLIRKFQVIQQKKMTDFEKQLAALQLETLNNYLDPHFTFNTLNTITALIYKENKDKAYEVITRFTSLIRGTMMQSGSVSRTLESELEFVKNYLDIQKFRFGNMFNWEIKREEPIDTSLPVPKMLIQQYTENAIKHGLKNKAGEGKLEIILCKADKETIIVIRDNGVGRQNAHGFNEPGTGKGITTMQKIFDLFEKINKIKISQTITDLKDEEGKAAGTEVVITVKKS